MVDRRLVEDPHWVRDLELPDYVREFPGTAKRRVSSFLDRATDSLSRFIELAEDGAVRQWDKVKTARIPTMTQLTQTLPKRRTVEPAPPARTAEAAPAVSRVADIRRAGAAPRSWPFFVSEKFLTGAIIAATVVLILLALRTTQMVAIHVMEFLTQSVNDFLTRLGFPPAL